MKEIKAYVRATQRDAVIDALEALGNMPGVAVVPVEEYGHAVETARLKRIDMVKLEVDVPDEMVFRVVETISESARTGTGHAGDGRIVVLDVLSAQRIADGSEGNAALV